MKNFIDFIVDAAKDSKLGEEFQKNVADSDHKTISSWLSGKGYDIHEDDVKKIVENKDVVQTGMLGYIY